MEETLPRVIRTPEQVYRDWRYYREFGSQVAQYGANRPIDDRVEELTRGIRELLHTVFDHQVVQGQVPTAEGLQSLKQILAQRSTPATPPTLPSKTPAVIDYQEVIWRSVVAAILAGLILGVFWLLRG
jgi:hypothetical protein